MHAVAHGEQLGNVTEVEETCDECILTKDDKLIAHTGIVNTAVVGGKLTGSESLGVAQFVALLVILVTLEQRLGESH